MGELIELYKSIMSDPEKKQATEKTFIFMARKMKETCREDYKKAFLIMHEALYHGHFCERLAKKAVSDMKNVDGTTGGKWSKEETDKVMQQYGVHADSNDFYYVMNMMISDYEKVLNTDAGTYAKMADAYLNDPDAPKDKALKTYLSTHDVD
nr:MAG TPA: hypothetical protein [Caudoviricetes sp.]